MQSIIEWLSVLGAEFPQLSFLKYIIAAVLLLVVVDATLNLLFAAIGKLVSGK